MVLHQVLIANRLVDLMWDSDEISILRIDGVPIARQDYLAMVIVVRMFIEFLPLHGAVALGLPHLSVSHHPNTLLALLNMSIH